jgi:leucyl-tRNA synthetase
MKRYNPLEIEAKWQKIWDAQKTFSAKDHSDKPKAYISGMFPYPSGAGLHVGHVRSYSIVDALARFERQNGKNVLEPMGWDTFGLPTENYAIKTGVSPQIATSANVASFKNQLKRIGASIDWDREIETSDPKYYKWTQWIFKRLFEKGLAYRSESYQWWCPVDKTVLANEQVESGHCWRCGAEVEKRKMRQWFFKITAYADELLADIDSLDWPEKIKAMQRNWIGRSEGAEITFATDKPNTKITVFTTRPDTIHGATFLVIAPEHPLVNKLTDANTRQTIDQYREASLKKSEIERQENKQKTGVFTGSHAINPLSGEKLPIWVADYVLGGYGTGAIMAVPAHDERDHEFATKFNLPIVDIEPDPTAIDQLEQIGAGQKKVTYKMRDWLISRQRYWGAPIPIAYDATGKAHAIPDEDLPVLLPEISDFTPDESGHSALAKSEDFLKVTIGGEEMTRETDTMDGYACSSWYLLRYCDPNNTEQPWDKAKVDYLCPVDAYVGGDHAVAHLLYVRFWCKFFADEGLLDFREPVKKLLYNGYINAPDGKKMSKSKGNVIDPLDIIDQGYGADALRLYELFIAPYDQDAAWNTKGLAGAYRFLQRVWVLTQEYLENHEENHATNAKTAKDSLKLRQISSKMVKKVTEDLKNHQFNTAIAGLMEAVNELYLFKVEDNFASSNWREVLGDLVKCLAPFAPHLACECFETLGFIETIEQSGWPTWNEADLVANEAELVVQVNGKVRGKTMIASGDLSDEAKIKDIALNLENVQTFIKGRAVRKVIIVAKNRLVNIVV